MIRYQLPENWIKYDKQLVANSLVEAKATILSLRTIPYQRIWVETLQKMELKREVAGTSRIEGAELTEKELDAVLEETAEQLHTRSQRQARAAVRTYQRIAKIPDGRPIDENLIKEIHRLIVTGADDDHCPPGEIRRPDQNVNFGQPRHRGAAGGDECVKALAGLAEAIQHEYPKHDLLIQALAVHYHLVAAHPFLDGNGRTARALEALVLQRAGLRDTCFIAMSNYYYDEKNTYLNTLREVRANNHDLTSFLVFALKGVELQSRRLLTEIQHQISKELFRNLMHDLFGRLKTPRKMVIAKRQIKILNLLLQVDWMDLEEIIEKSVNDYKKLSNPRKAIIRDLNDLIRLTAVKFEKLPDNRYRLGARLEWPTEITETAFFEELKKLPKARAYSFLQQ